MVTLASKVCYNLRGWSLYDDWTELRWVNKNDKAFGYKSLLSRRRKLQDENEVCGHRDKALGNGSANTTLCHAAVRHTRIRLGTNMKRAKVLEQITLPREQHKWWNGGLDSFGHKQHRSNTGYRKKLGSQCNIYPNRTKPAFHPLWPFHQVHNCLWQNSLAETL